MRPSGVSGPMPTLTQAFGSGAAEAAPPAPTASANANAATIPHLLLKLLPTLDRVCGRPVALSIGRRRLFVAVVPPGLPHADRLVQTSGPLVVSMDTERGAGDAGLGERRQRRQQQRPAKAAAAPRRSDRQLSYPSHVILDPVLG